MRCLFCAFLVAINISVSLAQVPSDLNSSNIPFSQRMFDRAQSGSPRDEFLLGHAYASGSGVRQDHEQALYWYRRSANHGDDSAINELGRMYAEGNGVPRDYQQALLWFRRAASDGSPAAQTNLGMMYFRGLGTAPDSEGAVQLWRKAADKGFLLAQSNLGFAYLEGTGSVKSDPALAAKLLRKAATRGLAE